MQQIITAKLKLTTTKEQFEALRQTQLAYRDALNAVSRYAFSQGKTSNVTRLHKGMYAELRVRSHLPSQLACSVERQVASTYKGLWTKLKKNVEHRRAKITKKRFKGLDKPPKYSSPTVQYTYERDYTFQRDSQVSVGTLNGRISIPYQGYDKHSARIRQGATIGDAKLWYDRQCQLSSRETNTTPSQSLRTLTQTLAAKRHSWRETSLETHRATRETVKSSGKPLHRQPDHQAAPTRTDRARAPH
jgi:putative transposase